jgi:hypothetical protein
MSSVVQLLAVSILLASASTAPAAPVFEPKTICRTAIATVMDRDPKLVQAKDALNGVVALTYARPFDNFVFAYRCRIEGDHVVWADDPGRWRNGTKDAKVSFELAGAGDRLRIIISRANGTSLQQLFDRELNVVH